MDGATPTLPTARHEAAARLAAGLRRLRAADDAVAAIEFGLALPTLLIVLLGGAQVVSYIDASRKVDLIANSISQMVSQAMPPDGQTVARINATDVHFSFDSTLVLFPDVMSYAKRVGVEWWQVIAINYAGIAFERNTTKPCTATDDLSPCYTAKVMWTSPGASQPADGPGFRPCDTPQAPVDDTAEPSRTTLPRSAFGPSSLIVIDVVFNFKPTFGSGLVAPVRIARTAYVQPRYAARIQYDMTNNTGIATSCKGY